MSGYLMFDTISSNDNEPLVIIEVSGFGSSIIGISKRDSVKKTLFHQDVKSCRVVLTEKVRVNNGFITGYMLGHKLLLGLEAQFRQTASTKRKGFVRP
jgi:hypothetical protein